MLFKVKNVRKGMRLVTLASNDETEVGKWGGEGYIAIQLTCYLQKVTTFD